jgi:hypothetical protein
MQRIEARDALSGKQPAMRFVCRIRSCNSNRALAAYPTTASSSVGGTTIAQTRGSPRVYASSVLKSVSPSIASVLARRPAPRHCDGRWIDNMTFNAVRLKQPMDPKAVQSSFLDHHNLHRMPRQLLSPRPHALQQTEQRATIAA